MIFRRHRHLLHDKLPHIDLLSALYDPKRVLVNKGVLVNKEVLDDNGVFFFKVGLLVWITRGLDDKGSG